MPAVAFLTSLFSAAHPVVSIDIQSMTSRAIQRAIDSFEIECGLTYLDNEPLENVRQVPLYQERYVFITKRGNRYADRQSLTWAEAVQERLCLPNEDMQNRRIIDKIAASAGLRIGANVVTNSFAGRLLASRPGGLVEHRAASVSHRARPVGGYRGDSAGRAGCNPRPSGWSYRAAIRSRRSPVR